MVDGAGLLQLAMILLYLVQIFQLFRFSLTRIFQLFHFSLTQIFQLFHFFTEGAYSFSSFETGSFDAKLVEFPLDVEGVGKYQSLIFRFLLIFTFFLDQFKNFRFEIRLKTFCFCFEFIPKCTLTSRPSNISY